MDLSQLKKENKGYLKEEKVIEIKTSQAPKRSGGRKQVQDEPMDQKITFSLTKSEKEKIMEYCDDIGMSLSICIRRALKGKDLI